MTKPTGMTLSFMTNCVLIICGLSTIWFNIHLANFHFMKQSLQEKILMESMTSSSSKQLRSRPDHHVRIRQDEYVVSIPNNNNNQEEIVSDPLLSNSNKVLKVIDDDTEDENEIKVVMKYHYSESLPQVSKDIMDSPIKSPIEDPIIDSPMVNTTLSKPNIVENDDTKLRHEWDKDINGNVTLVITDWLGITPELISFLQNDIPNFIDDIILIVAFGTNIDNLPLDLKSKIRLVHRGTMGTRDLCSIEIKTKWFFATSTYAPNMKPQVPITTTRNGKIVVPYVTMADSECANHDYCRFELILAQAFMALKQKGQEQQQESLTPRIFQQESFPFHTGLRNEYCKRVMAVTNFDERFPTAQPSATSFMAYLQVIDVINDYYVPTNMNEYNCRPKLDSSSFFVTQKTMNNNDGCEQDIVVQQDNSSVETTTTTTTCPIHAPNYECQTLPNCEYRPKSGCPVLPNNNNDQSNLDTSFLTNDQQERLSKQRALLENVNNKQELFEKIQSAHDYWLNPTANTDDTGYVPVSTIQDYYKNGTTTTTAVASLPDKIFVCADYYELLIFFPYFEGDVIVLSHQGVMYFDPLHVPPEAHTRRNANREIVQLHATEKSLLLGNVLLLHDCLPDAINDFPGQQFLRNTEVQGFNFLTKGEQQRYYESLKYDNHNNDLPTIIKEPDPQDYLPPSDKVFVIGPHADSPTSIRVPYLSFRVANRGRHGQDQLFNHELKPVSTREHFLIYAASHFIGFREDAIHQIAQAVQAAIGNGGNSEIHTVGKCQGTGKGSNSKCIPYTDEERPSYIKHSPHELVDDNNNNNNGGGGGGAVSRNHELYRHYRFAMVFENTKQDGYITEKIVNAFLSGAIPIWYGTRHDIFDIFNEKAFIYYNVENPQPALDKIVLLETNTSAYNEMLCEPILKAPVKDTIEKWFSIRDEVGNGKLKQRILSKMGYRDYASTAIFGSYNK